jgi:hypothetical protein
MNKWFYDFEISDNPLQCETYYDKELKQRICLLESGQQIEVPLVDMYDTELECVEAMIEELKFMRATDMKNKEILDGRWGMCMFHKRRIQLQEMGL